MPAQDYTLVTLLDVKSLEYDSRELKKMSDRENPLNRINQYCRLHKQFLNAHSWFIRDNLQDYLNLFVFIMNPPEDKSREKWKSS